MNYTTETHGVFTVRNFKDGAKVFMIGEKLIAFTRIADFHPKKYAYIELNYIKKGEKQFHFPTLAKANEAIISMLDARMAEIIQWHTIETDPNIYRIDRAHVSRCGSPGQYYIHIALPGIVADDHFETIELNHVFETVESCENMIKKIVATGYVRKQYWTHIGAGSKASWLKW